MHIAEEIVDSELAIGLAERMAVVHKRDVDMLRDVALFREFFQDVLNHGVHIGFHFLDLLTSECGVQGNEEEVMSRLEGRDADVEDKPAVKDAADEHECTSPFTRPTTGLEEHCFCVEITNNIKQFPRAISGHGSPTKDTLSVLEGSS